MADLSAIREHAEVIGDDGVHVGTVRKVEGGRIILAKRDSADRHHHYVSTGFVHEVRDGKVLLGVSSAIAVSYEDE